MGKLTIPLDASGIVGLDHKQPIKVLVTAGGKPVASERVTLDKQGKGQVALDVDGGRGVRVIVGPADATDEELTGLQTLAVDLPGRRWRGADGYVMPAIRITPYYWFWWLRWCRTFTINGRVLCPDGSPVPGAVVCAYDVDAWWWWWSKQLVGCATTDASGSFSLTFRWCCGWWPWWWWRLRHWVVEPVLSKHIFGALQREPRFPRVPLPDPAPDLRVLEALAGGHVLESPVAVARSKAPTLASRATAAVARRVTASIDPSLLDGLRDRLVKVLPDIPALAGLRLWPWHPWHPWWDCTPDIIFRVTQQCGGAQQVIVNEGYFDARFNIPASSEVTLAAGANACCFPPNDCLDGECLALAKVCTVDADEVGGNPGADPTPAGYAFPNALSTIGDAPFAGVVNIRGTAQCMSDIDYYEIEFTADGGATWSLVPPDALGAFTREYWDFVLGTDVDVPFSASVPVDGRNVYETIEHYEATHTPADWGATKAWLGTNIDLVFPWVTDGNFGDGTYGLRVVGYDEAGGVLSNPRVLTVCDTNTPSTITVTLDNQTLIPPPGPASNPCGSGTTHTCTNEPETDILDARIVRTSGEVVTLGACGKATLVAGDVLEVDFVAHDAQGHLAFYDLIATYGENAAVPLLALAGATLSPLPGGAPPVPAAAQVGPTYPAARGQGAAAPTWVGGAIRLSVSAQLAFPDPCCYQLELRAYKRTIVNCNQNFVHRNLSERSFQVSF